MWIWFGVVGQLFLIIIIVTKLSIRITLPQIRVNL